MNNILIAMSFLLLCTPSAYASHSNPDALEGTLLLVAYSPTVTAPINIINGIKREDKLVWPIVGIVEGAAQAAIGVAVLASSQLDNDTKAMFGPMLAAGAINIGAGVFAIARRTPTTASVAPVVVTDQGMAPGLSMSIPLP